MHERTLLNYPPIRPFIGLGPEVVVGVQTIVEMPQPERARPNARTIAAIGETTVRAEYAPHSLSFNVESDSEIMDARQSARQEAEAIMEAHVQSLSKGEYDKVPLEADAGGTARKLVAVGKAFGKDSPEYAQGWQALLRDCERRIGEARRLYGWELFDVTELELEPETGDFFSDGFNVSEMLRNGITPATNPACPEEPARRVNEFVEGITDVALMEKPYMQGRSTYTCSQCPQSLIDRYKSNPAKSVYSDYAPPIEKMMVREKRFDPANNKIYMRQMAIPGTYITNEVVNIALAEMEIIDGERQLDRTEVHGTQAVVSNELVPDVVAMVRRLDEAASKYHGRQIYLGLPLEPGQHADYEGVYEEAEKRRLEQQDLTERYARLLVQLEETGLDRELVNYEADTFVRTELLNIAKFDPEKAEMMFGSQTAQGFREANKLEAQGRFDEARELRMSVEENAPPAGGCGAGVCGIEKMSKAEEDATKELLNVKSGEKTAKDTQRACANCGAKAIVYAWNEKIVKKGCGSCGITEGVKGQTKPFIVTLQRPQTKEVVTVTTGEKTTITSKKRAA